MKTSLALLTVLFLASSGAGALAAATPEEAQRLTAVFQAYLTAEPGVVSVTPAGDAYAVKIDAAPFFARNKEPGFSAAVTPFEFTLAGQGGGKWKFDQDQPISYSFKADGSLDMNCTITSLKGTGIFDEAIGSFASQTADLTGMVCDETVTDKGAATKIGISVASMHVDATLTAAGDGADGSGKLTLTDFKETVSTAAGEAAGSSPMDFTLAAPSLSEDFTVKGMKTRAILELVAWAVAHPGSDAIKAAQAEFKDKLRAVLPVFQNITGIVNMDKVTVGTMMGEAGIDKLGITIEATGAVADGRLREAFTVDGLRLPQGLLPPFAADLLPSHFVIDFNVSDYDLAAPAKLMLDNLDMSKEPQLPPEIEAQLTAAVMPKGSVTIGLGPSEVVAKLYDLKAEGSMTAGPASIPAGQATIMLKGLDEVMTAIQAAPPEMGLQQAAPVIIIAKGMAKAGADGTLTWIVESTPQGGVLVNGVDVTKMGGQ